VSARAALVVGAGPAGCIAALVLARAGVPVRLIDRSSFPRDKLCGDTINPGALAMLDRLGAGRDLRAGGGTIHGMTISGPGGVRVVADYPAGVMGLSVRRRDFDGRLLALAMSAGVCVEQGIAARAPLLAADGRRVTGARLVSRGREYDLPASIVIAADGRASRLAAALRLCSWASGPRRWAFRAYFEDVAGMSAHGEMHIRPGGYLGLATVPDGAVNVCVVRGMGTAPPGGLAPEAALAEAITGDPLLRERFGRARRVSPAAALGPLAVEARGAGWPGLLLAGDAAGFVDPMTGDGMQYAIRGGELAALAALRELSSGTPAHQWLARRRRREFAARWWLNRRLRTLVASPRALRVAARVAAVWDAPVRRVVEIAAGVG
jgi:menaquinone-9 beta-reductase